MERSYLVLLGGGLTVSHRLACPPIGWLMNHIRILTRKSPLFRLVDVPPPQGVDFVRIKETGKEETESVAIIAKFLSPPTGKRKGEGIMWVNLTFAGNMGRRSDLERQDIDPLECQQRDWEREWQLYLPFWVAANRRFFAVNVA